MKSKTLLLAVLITVCMAATLYAGDQKAGTVTVKGYVWIGMRLYEGAG